MDKELLLKSDILDIIFEKRNKAYGAYDLRKHYGDRLLRSVGTMLAIVLVLSAFTFLPKKNKVTRDNGDIVFRTYTIPEPKENKKEPEKPKTPEKPVAQKPAQAVFNKPVIVDAKTSTSILPSNLDSVAIGSTTTSAPTGTGPAVVTPAGQGNNNEPVTAVKPVMDKTIPIANPDVMPSYPGGWDALKKFLERNLRNPKDMDEGEVVSVKVKFVVGYDGKLQSFVTAKEADEEYYKEVIRVLKKMPEWIPGQANGENISVYYTIPVKFVPAE